MNIDKEHYNLLIDLNGVKTSINSKDKIKDTKLLKQLNLGNLTHLDVTSRIDETNKETFLFAFNHALFNHKDETLIFLIKKSSPEIISFIVESFSDSEEIVNKILDLYDSK